MTTMAAMRFCWLHTLMGRRSQLPSSWFRCPSGRTDRRRTRAIMLTDSRTSWRQTAAFFILKIGRASSFGLPTTGDRQHKRTADLAVRTGAVGVRKEDSLGI
jgi:hypothetical protein